MHRRSSPIHIDLVSPNRAQRLPLMRRTRPKQITIDFRKHGGARPGAGRKPNGAKAGVAHEARGAVGGAMPVLVTMKLLAGVTNLRNQRRCRAVLASLRRACDRFHTRIVEFSVQHDHVHLVVETKDARSLSRSMQGLAVRLARALNRSLGRRGKIFKERFHHRVLGTPRQVRNALGYVLCNARKHRAAPNVSGWLDPLSSAGSFDGWRGRTTRTARLTPPPRTWLLRIGWRREGLLSPDHTPGPLT
jgi:REP element-mobilizing transposase RayT